MSDVVDLQQQRSLRHTSTDDLGAGASAERPNVLSAYDKVKGAPVLETLEQAWWALASADSLPHRADITAEVIGAALPYAMIVERIAPGHARLRVAGRRVSALVGCEARGMPMSCLFEPGARSEFGNRLEAVFHRPAIVDLPVGAPRRVGHPSLTGRLVMLPLTASRDPQTGPVTMALAALLIDGSYGTTPRRLTFDLHGPWRCDQINRSNPAKIAAGFDPNGNRAPQSEGPSLHLVVDNS